MTSVGGDGGQTPTVTTGSISNIGQTGATLSASFSGVTSGSILQSGFVYGTSSSNLTQVVECDPPSGSSGSFQVSISGLSSGTKYYYQPFIKVGTQEYRGSVSNFTTSDSSPVTGSSDEATYAKSWISNYEYPETNVVIASGKPYHSTANETHGSTKAYIYNPSVNSSSQVVVTHTFSYNSDVKRNYSMLYDKNKKCALWVAYAMNKDEYPDKNVGRNQGWGYDPAITQSWQPNLSGAYDGYSRGHQIASNDRQTTVEENKQTFYYSNMMPQNSSLNSGQWGALETKINGLGTTQISGRDTLYVVTGPLFSSNPSTTTDNSGVSCPVPSGFFKAIMLCSFDTNGNMTSAKACGYYFNSNSSNVAYQLKTIDELETLTGFNFFANVPSSIQATAEATNYSFF